MSRALLSVVVVLVLAVIAATVWAVGFRKPGNNTASGGTGAQREVLRHRLAPRHGGRNRAQAGRRQHVQHRTSTPGNTEDPTLAVNAIDGNGTTGWATSYYFGSPKFGGLKPGTGLLINMGQQVKLSQVKLQFGPGTTTAGIYLGNSGPSLGDVEQRAVLLQAGLALRRRAPAATRST